MELCRPEALVKAKLQEGSKIQDLRDMKLNSSNIRLGRDKETNS